MSYNTNNYVSAPYPSNTVNYSQYQGYNNNNQNQYQQNYSQPVSNAPPIDQPPAYQERNQPSKEELFRNIINKYEISQFFASKLQLLFSFKIVFVFDDSGSMNSVLNDSPLNTGILKATRWDELQYFSKISIEIANVFNQNGTDVYFLNRPMARNVRLPEDLNPYFMNKPSGYTPLARVLRQVLANNNTAELNERKLLIIIVTDGEPTDDNGRVDIHGFKDVLKSRLNNTFTTIVSCTDEDNTMDYLNNWDRTIPRLDVVDDFRNERIEIQRSMGRQFAFSFGDYVVKSLIGSIDVSLDNLDERVQTDCCSIL